MRALSRAVEGGRRTTSPCNLLPHLQLHLLSPELYLTRRTLVHALSPETGGAEFLGEAFALGNLIQNTVADAISGMSLNTGSSENDQVKRA